VAAWPYVEETPEEGKHRPDVANRARGNGNCLFYSHWEKSRCWEKSIVSNSGILARDLVGLPN